MNSYDHFSLVFSFPTPETLKAIRESAQTGDAAGRRSAEALGAVSLEEAQAEFTRLFISDYPGLLCPPYESYFREGIVYGQTAIEVGEWYRKSGLSFAGEGEPPDLVSAELEYLALTQDDAFLARMKEWIFQFTKRVKQNSALYGPCAVELETILSGKSFSEP